MRSVGISVPGTAEPSFSCGSHQLSRRTRRAARPQRPPTRPPRRGTALARSTRAPAGARRENRCPAAHTGLELLENSAATPAGLFTIIPMFARCPPALQSRVWLVDASFGGFGWRDALAYVPAQIGGYIRGAIAANLMFAQVAISISTEHGASRLARPRVRRGDRPPGLLLVIFSLARTRRAAAAPAAVALRPLPPQPQAEPLPHKQAQRCRLPAGPHSTTASPGSLHDRPPELVGCANSRYSPPQPSSTWPY
jgi:hypothetical protein